MLSRENLYYPYSITTTSSSPEPVEGAEIDFSKLLIDPANPPEWKQQTTETVFEKKLIVITDWNIHGDILEDLQELLYDRYSVSTILNGKDIVPIKHIEEIFSHFPQTTPISDQAVFRLFAKKKIWPHQILIVNHFATQKKMQPPLAEYQEINWLSLSVSINLPEDSRKKIIAIARSTPRLGIKITRDTCGFQANICQPLSSLVEFVNQLQGCITAIHLEDIDTQEIKNIYETQLTSDGINFIHTMFANNKITFAHLGRWYAQILSGLNTPKLNTLDHLHTLAISLEVELNVDTLLSPAHLTKLIVKEIDDEEETSNKMGVFFEKTASLQEIIFIDNKNISGIYDGLNEVFPRITCHFLTSRHPNLDNKTNSLLTKTKEIEKNYWDEYPVNNPMPGVEKLSLTLGSNVNKYTLPKFKTIQELTIDSGLPINYLDFLENFTVLKKLTLNNNFLNRNIKFQFSKANNIKFNSIKKLTLEKIQIKLSELMLLLTQFPRLNKILISQQTVLDIDIKITPLNKEVYLESIEIAHPSANLWHVITFLLSSCPELKLLAIETPLENIKLDHSQININTIKNGLMKNLKSLNHAKFKAANELFLASSTNTKIFIFSQSPITNLNLADCPLGEMLDYLKPLLRLIYLGIDLIESNQQTEIPSWDYSNVTVTELNLTIKTSNLQIKNPVIKNMLSLFPNLCHLTCDGYFAIDNIERLFQTHPILQTLIVTNIFFSQEVESQLKEFQRQFPKAILQTRQSNAYIASNNTLNNELTLNPNTVLDENKIFRIMPYFRFKKAVLNPAEETTTYRLASYAGLTADGNLQPTPTPDDIEVIATYAATDVSILSHEYQQHHEDDFAIRACDVSVPVSQEWQQLPSFSAEEIFFEAAANHNMRIGFSRSQRFHFICFDKNELEKKASVIFLVQLPKTDTRAIPYVNIPDQVDTRVVEIIKEFNALPNAHAHLKKLKQLQFSLTNGNVTIPDNFNIFFSQFSSRELLGLFATYFNEFTPGTIPSCSNTDSLLQKHISSLNMMWQHKHGACHNRVLLMARIIEILKRFGYQAIKNASHLRIECAGLTVCLGGYPATLVLQSQAMPTAKNKIANTLAENKNEEEQGVSLTIETLHDKLQLFPKNERQALIFIKEEQAPDIMMKFKDHVKTKSKKLIIVDCLEALENKQESRIRDGELYAVPSKLHERICKAKSGDHLIMQWRSKNTLLDLRFTGLTALFNNKREWNNLKIADGVVIIVLVTPDIQQQLPNDFGSFFPVKVDNFLYTPNSLFNITDVNETPLKNKNYYTIDFYELEESEKKIIGKRKTDKNNKYVWQKPDFVEKLSTIETLILQNPPPLHTIGFFEPFLGLIADKCIKYNEEEIRLPDTLKIILTQQAYTFPGEYTLTTHYSNDVPAWKLVLNTQRFNAFFQRNQYTSAGILEIPGFLEQYRDQRIAILISENINANRLSCLLNEAQRWNCTIDFYQLPSINLPEEFVRHAQITAVSTLEKNKNIDAPNKHQPRLIFTNDAAYAWDMLKKERSEQFEQLIYIPVNEKTTYSSLFQTIHANSHITGKKTTATTGSTSSAATLIQLSFTTNNSQILHDLKQEKNVVVFVGNLSENVLQLLLTAFSQTPRLFVNEAEEDFSAEFILIQPENSLLKEIGEGRIIQADLQDYFKRLGEHFPAEILKDMQQTIEKYAFLRQQAWNYTQLYTLANTWQQNQRKVLKALLAHDFDLLKKILQHVPKTSKPKYISWQEEQNHVLNKIWQGITQHTNISLIGPTGIGKSTLIFNYFENYVLSMHGKRIRLYSGINNIGTWQSAHQPQKNSEKEIDLHILILDEANQERMPSFEGVYDDQHKTTKPFLYRDLVYLSQRQHIIFISNFNNDPEYPGRVKQDFVDHGNIILMKEWSREFLYHTILESGLSMLILDSAQRIIINNLFLDGYYFAKQALKLGDAMTIRNLERMVMHLQTLCQQSIPIFREELKNLAKHVMFSELRLSLTHEQRVQLKTEFNIIEKNAYSNYKNSVRLPLHTTTFFAMTHNFKNPLWYLHQHFMKWRLALQWQAEKKYPELYAYANFGLLLQGESGKSLLIATYLKSQRLIEGKDYICIAPTNLQHAENMLRAAKANNQIVILRNLNTLPLEKILNELMGSGLFMIFATQYSAENNTTSSSKAFANRFVTVKMKSFSRNDLIEIFKSHGQTQNSAQQLTDDYLKKSALSKERNKLPPTLRETMREIKQTEIKQKMG